MKTTIPILLASMFLASPLFAQGVDSTADEERNIRAYIELMRSDVRAQKNTILFQVLNLTEAESAKFRPVYHEYELELTKLWDQKLKLIKDYVESYDDLKDAKAHEIAMALFDADAKRTELRKKYFLRFEQAVSSTVAARFIQVENQLLMLLDLQVASKLPIVQ